MDRKFQVSYTSCILVQFCNENDSVGIGFSCWLEKSDEAIIQTLISSSEEVKIVWPKIEIQPTKNFKKNLHKLKSEDWIYHSIKILAVGGTYVQKIILCTKFEVGNLYKKLKYLNVHRSVLLYLINTYYRLERRI